MLHGLFRRAARKGTRKYQGKLLPSLEETREHGNSCRHCCHSCHCCSVLPVRAKKNLKANAAKSALSRGTALDILASIGSAGISCCAPGHVAELGLHSYYGQA